MTPVVAILTTIPFLWTNLFNGWKRLAIEAEAISIFFSLHCSFPRFLGNCSTFQSITRSFSINVGLIRSFLCVFLCIWPPRLEVKCLFYRWTLMIWFGFTKTLVLRLLLRIDARWTVAFHSLHSFTVQSETDVTDRCFLFVPLEVVRWFVLASARTSWLFYRRLLSCRPIGWFCATPATPASCATLRPTSSEPFRYSTQPKAFLLFPFEGLPFLLFTDGLRKIIISSFILRQGQFHRTLHCIKASLFVLSR